MGQGPWKLSLIGGAVEEFNKLKEDTGLSSNIEVMGHALRFLQIVQETRRRGGHLLVLEDGRIRVAILPFPAPPSTPTASS